MSVVVTGRDSIMMLRFHFHQLSCEAGQYSSFRNLS